MVVRRTAEVEDGGGEILSINFRFDLYVENRSSFISSLFSIQSVLIDQIGE